MRARAVLRTACPTYRACPVRAAIDAQRACPSLFRMGSAVSSVAGDARALRASCASATTGRRPACASGSWPSSTAVAAIWRDPSAGRSQDAWPCWRASKPARGPRSGQRVDRRRSCSCPAPCIPGARGSADTIRRGCSRGTRPNGFSVRCAERSRADAGHLPRGLLGPGRGAPTSARRSPRVVSARGVSESKAPTCGWSTTC